MKFQQRRLFGTATSVPMFRWQRMWKAGPFRPWGRIAAILPALLLFSCASITPDRAAILAAIAGQAAQIGAEQWLIKHPEHRDSFNMIIAAIQALVRAGNTNQAAYAELLNGLPTSTLTGPEAEGAVYITETSIVVRDNKTDKSYVGTMPMMRAAVAGLKRGTARMPPPLPSFNRHRPVKESVTVQTNELTDAQLDAQFEEVRTKIDAKAGRKTDYVVEYKAGETNWTSAVLITNAPVGQWRVRRVR